METCSFFGVLSFPVDSSRRIIGTMSVIDNEATAINTKTAFAFGNPIVPPSVLCRRTERTDLYPELRRFADVDNIARLALGELDQNEKSNVLGSVLVGPAACGNETEQKLMNCSSFLCFRRKMKT